MKNFKFLAIFITYIAFTQHNLTYTTNTEQQKLSLTSYIYATLWQPIQTLPAANTTDKNVIIFDLDGVLCKTNDLQAFYEIGMQNLIQYMISYGTPSNQKLFEALAQTPAITTYQAYNEGLLMPQIMVDWQCNAQELRDIQDSMIKHILCAKNLDITQKNLFVSVILMMTNPDTFIRTRQAIPDGIHLARNLKKLGYKLYVLSNWDATSFPLFVEKFPEIFTYEGESLFDGIMISGKVGVVKPQAEFFEHCCEKFDITPNKAIFIDDTIENIQAAQDHGLHTIHCQNKNIGNVKKDLINILTTK